MSSPVYQPNPLTNLKEQVDKHWGKFRPAMYRDLKKSGDLERVLGLAVKLTEEAYGEAVESGLKFDQAWELVREQWAFLPEERRSTELPFDAELLQRKEDPEAR